MTLTYTDSSGNSQSLTIGDTSNGSAIVKYGVNLKKNATAVPIPGMFIDDSNNYPAALIWDEGGISISHNVMFVETFSDVSSMQSRMRTIIEFLNNIPIASGVKVTFDEVWGSNSKDMVVSSFDISYDGGTAYVIRGTIILLEGKIVTD